MKILTFALTILLGVIGTHCLRPCETCLLQPIGPEMGTPCSIVTCPCSNACANTCNVCTNVCTNVCQCSVPQCGCSRDVACPCNVCPPTPSPVCSCLDACGCDCAVANGKLYFPEVEYPATVLDIKPSYYGSCWTY